MIKYQLCNLSKLNRFIHSSGARVVRFSDSHYTIFTRSMIVDFVNKYNDPYIVIDSDRECLGGVGKTKVYPLSRRSAIKLSRILPDNTFESIDDLVRRLDHWSYDGDDLNLFAVVEVDDKISGSAYPIGEGKFFISSEDVDETYESKPYEDISRVRASEIYNSALRILPAVMDRNVSIESYLRGCEVVSYDNRGDQPTRIDAERNTQSEISWDSGHVREMVSNHVQHMEICTADTQRDLAREFGRSIYPFFSLGDEMQLPPLRSVASFDWMIPNYSYSYDIDVPVRSPQEVAAASRSQLSGHWGGGRNNDQQQAVNPIEALSRSPLNFDSFINFSISE